MKGLTNSTEWADMITKPDFSETQLIDLFVDMCFYDINSPIAIYQFKLVAKQLQFSSEMIERVVELGKSEYHELYAEMEKQLSSTFI